MADQPDRPDESPHAATPGAEPPPPAAEKATPPKKAAKKAPAKKAAAKKTPAKKAADNKTPAKKTPAKKTPAKKAPPAKAAPPPPESGADLATAAKQAAAQAKSNVATASDAVTGLPPHQPGTDTARLPIAAALITGLLAIVVVVWVARRSGDD